MARQLTARDALGAHARDELAISELTTARPLQAALASAATFAVGAALSLAVAWRGWRQRRRSWSGVVAASLVFLALLGALGAQAGGAGMARGVVRVVFWGALAMAVTAGLGKLFGTVI